MSDVPITTQAVGPSGTTPTATALSSGNTYQVVNDGETILRFVNTSDEVTVTFLVPRTTDPYTQRKANWPLSGLDPTRTVPALDEGSGSGTSDDVAGVLLVSGFPRTLFGDTLEFTVDASGASVEALRFQNAGRTLSGNSGWEPSGYPEPEGSGSGSGS